MNETIEALITTDSSTSGGSFTCNVYDIQTGTIIHSYKNGGVCTPQTLCQINNDYILTAENLKPLLHVWQLNSQEPLPKSTIRLVVPGNVNCLTVSPNGMYCAAGIGEKLYVWQLATGRLLTVISKHFQAITKILFTKDGSYLITAGNDSLVLIWNVAHFIITPGQNIDLIVAQTVAGQIDPIYTISDHSMPVKDIFATDSRLITVSSDRTAKVYDLNAGRLLLSIVFDVCLTSVVLNNAETCAYIGGVNGEIFELSLINAPRNNPEYHFNTNKSNVFSGHGKSVTCLNITLDGNILVSGSSDEQVIVWHISTKQKLRTIPHRGTINNLHFMITRKNAFHQEFKPTTVIQSFERNVNADYSDDYINVVHKTDIGIQSKYIDQITREVFNKEITSEGNQMQDEINKLKSINARLYKYALDNITQAQQTNKRKRQ